MLVATAWLFCVARSSVAQQRSFTPPAPSPQTQSQGRSGSTLTLPANRHQANENSYLPPASAQPGQALTVAPHELRRQMGYEQVTVTVTDQQGRYRTGLNRDDFKLYVDGKQRPIQFFRQDLNTPVSVGILVDTSGSMTPKLPQARAAIREFVNDLNARDDVFLFAFSDQPFLLQPFTTDHSLVIGRLSLLSAYGATALFDTINDGLLMLRHGRWDKKALLVVTDGMDNDSQASVQEVIGQARRMGVLVYSIGIGQSNIAPRASVSFFGLSAGDNDEVDARTLQTLSSETGARTFILREIGDGMAMRQDCAAISNELREQYTLGFVAPDAARGGYRSIRVDASGHPGDTVRVRKGVTVNNSTESASNADPNPPY